MGGPWITSLGAPGTVGGLSKNSATSDSTEKPASDMARTVTLKMEPG